MAGDPHSLLHHHLLQGIVERGRPPLLANLAELLGWSREQVRKSLHELEEAHALVLHPGSEDLWVIPPFSLVPTAFWVENDRRGWWASCVWCAFGVCALVEGPTRIHTRLAGEAEEVLIEVSANGCQPTNLVAHFPIPVRNAWDNVHRFCGSTLVFRDASHVDAWCERHSMPRGDVQPLERVQNLATRWYGGHLSPAWKKWTSAQAAEMFASLGLHGDTWQLPISNERF